MPADRRFRVVIADDAVLLREGLVGLLQRFGHTVVASVGRNTDTASHRAHIAFPAAGSACPRGTFPVPRLRVRVAYGVPPGRPFALDSFPEQRRDPRTDHAMFVNAMPDALMARITACVNEGRTCA
ncbi:hypothetical protein [Saccharothrix australiensis]|uniref:hypothetical protein n=1 Tax=Saccharothrix australiensis TaxID=2072 RepID=UPI0014772E0E|nr:hypothetical protein [Saccharothrix australiensis]